MTLITPKRLPDMTLMTTVTMTLQLTVPSCDDNCVYCSGPETD